MTGQINVKIPEQMEEDLEEVCDETGLSKSEITRRGLLNQIRDIRGGRSE